MEMIRKVARFPLKFTSLSSNLANLYAYSAAWTTILMWSIVRMYDSRCILRGLAYVKNFGHDLLELFDKICSGVFLR